MWTGGTLEVMAAAAHDGSYGLKVTPRSSSTRFVAIAFAPFRWKAIRRLRQRFWIHPNSMTIPSGYEFRVARNFFTSYNFAAYAIRLGYNASGYYINQSMYQNSDWDDTHYATSSNYTITNAWHYIEMDLICGSPGSQQLWIDGTSKSTLSCTNSEISPFWPALGCMYPGTTGFSTSGGFYIDSWTANDDGSVIGP